MKESERTYRVAHIIIDAFQLEIRCTKTDTIISVQQKPMEVLTYLIKHHPNLVTRAELIETVWNGNGYVGDKALTNAIWQLRSVFEQLGLNDFIQTVRKRGYRLTVGPEEAVPIETNLNETSIADAVQNNTSTLLSAKRLVVGSFTLLVIFLFWLSLQQGPSVISELEFAQPRILTPDTGRAQFAEISPDNSKLVYVWRSFNGKSNIFWQAIDDPTLRHQLTFSNFRESRPVWDHEGRYVLFLRQKNNGEQCSIFRVDIITKVEQRLTQCRYYGSNYLAAHPFKNEFYFNGSTRDNSNLYRLNLVDDQVNIEHIPCTAHCDYPVRDMAVSPDGKLLALTRRAHRFSEDLYVVDLATFEERRLTTQEVDVIGISWHPNNKSIVMASVESAQRNGYLVNIKTKEKTPLNIDNFGSPSRVNNDGTVYFHSVGTKVQLSYLMLNSPTPSSLFPITMSDYQYRDPHLNPKSGQFVFVSSRGGNDELWTADSDFRNIRQLTNLGSIVRYPRWSNNGKHIAFVARFPLEKRDVLTVLETATGRIQRLYEFEHVLGRPTWWHDDSKLVVRENGNLQQLDLATLEMSSLTHNGGIFGQSMPNGLLYFTKGSNQGLWVLSEAGEEQLVAPGDIFATRYSWVVGPTGAYFYGQTELTDNVSFYDFSSKEFKHMLTIPSELISTQSTFAYDHQNERLVIESWQARSRILTVQHPLLKLE